MQGFNPDDIIKQAQEMQSQLQQAHDELANLQVAGQSGAGLIKVVMTGRHDVKHLFIDQGTLEQAAQTADGKKILQELLAAAINDAVQRIEDATREKMAAMAQRFQLPQELIGNTGGSESA
jgi:nucleoid-associated protein EbfC